MCLLRRAFTINDHSSALLTVRGPRTEGLISIVLSLDLWPAAILRSDFATSSAWHSSRQRGGRAAKSHRTSINTSLITLMTALLASPSLGGAETLSSTASSVMALTPSRFLFTPGLTRQWMWIDPNGFAFETFVSVIMAIRAAMSSPFGSGRYKILKEVGESYGVVELGRQSVWSVGAPKLRFWQGAKIAPTEQLVG